MFAARFQLPANLRIDWVRFRSDGSGVQEEILAVLATGDRGGLAWGLPHGGRVP